MDKSIAPSLWLFNAKVDATFILGPPFICLFILWLMQAFGGVPSSVSLPAWMMLVLCIDVGHVYSTLYRTYFDPVARAKQRRLLYAVPAACLAISIVVALMDIQLFWRCMAYLAVWHFIRQQYGFLKLYNRKQPDRAWKDVLQQCAIYAATIYPLLFWHLSGNRNFHWFVEDDFVLFNAKDLLPPLSYSYMAIMLAYSLSEFFFRDGKKIHFPRLFWIWGTALSWYIGIVYFNSDLAFTLLNVVCHGIPYMALVAMKNRSMHQGSSKYRAMFLLTYIVSLLALAYFEEGLWDAWIWQEHRIAFPLFHFLSPLSHPSFIALAMAVLSLPQLTHYVLDGFIWKRSFDSA